jgi:hypothetical protein
VVVVMMLVVVVVDKLLGSALIAIKNLGLNPVSGYLYSVFRGGEGGEKGLTCTRTTSFGSEAGFTIPMELI